jgi:5-methylcytosine-specific restriction endonuclease McrA
VATHEFWKLSTVSDEQLLRSLGDLLIDNARVEARIVAHLAEVEERRLHLMAATSSMFEYCLRRIGLSESQAFHRITAARLARKFPLIFELLETRMIHLSALRVLRDHLTDENHRELLASASGKSRKEVEALVASLAPRPDVASKIRKLPAPQARMHTAGSAAPAPTVPPSSGSALATVEPAATPARSDMPGTAPTPTSNDASSLPHTWNLEPTDAADLPPSTTRREGTGSPPPAPRSPMAGRTLEPLSSSRYLLRLSMAKELKNKLELARDLMSHSNPSGELSIVLEKAVDLLLEKLERQRFARSRRLESLQNYSGHARAATIVIGTDGESLQIPRASTSCARDRSESVIPVIPSATKAQKAFQSGQARAIRRPRREHIPNGIRRAVHLRDDGQCTYTDGEGRRCASRTFLQLHHEHAHALGGPSTFENLRLLCSSHNRLLAERDFGLAHQARFTKEKLMTESEDEKTSGEASTLRAGQAQSRN